MSKLHTSYPTFDLDPEQLFLNGYSFGLITRDIYDIGKKYLKNQAKWSNGFPSVDLNTHGTTDDMENEEINLSTGIRETTGNDLRDLNEYIFHRHSRYKTPLEVKMMGEMVLKSSFIESIRKFHTRPNFYDKGLGWMKDISICNYEVHKNTESLPWHNDIDDPADYTFIIYFNEYEKWEKEYGGQLEFGIRKNLNVYDSFDDNNIKTLINHAPTDGSFAIINNTNPFFVHRVLPPMDKNIERNAFFFGIKINR